jgi:hypothetical protein
MIPDDQDPAFLAVDDVVDPTSVPKVPIDVHLGSYEDCATVLVFSVTGTYLGPSIALSSS